MDREVKEEGKGGKGKKGMGGRAWGVGEKRRGLK